jgi:chaperonin GroEL (HSP60 family)
MDIHPTTIITGYRMAANKAIEILRTKAEKVGDKREDLISVAKVPLASKIVRIAMDELSALTVEACEIVMEEDESTETGKTVNLSLINVLKQKGSTLRDSKLIKGVVIRKPILHPAMPKKIENAKIALLNTDLTAETRAIGVEIVPKDAQEIFTLREKYEKIMEDMVDTIVNSGAKVVVSQTRINPSAFQRLAKNGILCIDEVPKADMDRLLNAVGGRIVTVLETLEPQDLGDAGLVAEVMTGLTKYIEITECPNPKSVTIMLRGASDYLLDEAERIMIDCGSVVRDAIEDGLVVYGAGGVEVEIAKDLRLWAQGIVGTEQMAIMGFALALEEIPRQLAVNAGYSASGILAELRDKHQGSKKSVWWGVNVKEGGILDAKKENVMEPLRVKEQYIKGATDLAELIISVDDVIVTREGMAGRMKKSAEAGSFGISE